MLLTMPISIRALRPSLVMLLLLAGCAGTRPAAIESPPAEAVERPQRPVPHEIIPPPAYRRAIANGTRTDTGRPGSDYWIQEAEYSLRASIDPMTKWLAGSGEIVYTNNSPDDLEELHLELVQNFHAEGAMRIEFADVTGGIELSRIIVDGADLPPLDLVDVNQPHYEVIGTDLVLRPEAPLQSGSSVTLQIEWGFTIPQQGVGARMGHEGGNLIYVAYWYPVMAVYDDVEGWNTEQFMGRTEFYADFADYDVEIEMPAGWIVMSTGDFLNPEEVLADDVYARMLQAYESDNPVQIVGEDSFGQATQPGQDGLLTWRFRAENVRDVAFSATIESIWHGGRTAVGDRDGDGDVDSTHINTFYRQSAPLWADVTEYQQHAITFLSENTGFPYPWPHMTAVEGGGIIGGGMEFPMMTLMGDYTHLGDSALYNVTAHELGHMWVPMIVNINERRFSWIDEGITTFNENDARMSYHPGPNHFLADQDTYLRTARQENEGALMQHAGFHDTATAFVTASYVKPATLLAGLREILGEELFYRAFHTFVKDWAYKHPYPWDFFNTFERVGGQDLDWFWRSWYYETWTLDQAVATVESDGESTNVVIRDEGLAPMPVLLEVTLENGDVLHQRVPVEVWLTGETTTTVTLDTESPVARVEIDPDRKFPDIDRSDNVWTSMDEGTR